MCIETFIQYYADHKGAKYVQTYVFVVSIHHIGGILRGKNFMEDIHKFVEFMVKICGSCQKEIKTCRNTKFSRVNPIFCDSLPNHKNHEL